MIRRILTTLIRCYQRALSPFFPQSCRFYPTCSDYALEAITVYGPFKGVYKSIGRILRCNPFHPGGYDPV